MYHRRHHHRQHVNPFHHHEPPLAEHQILHQKMPIFKEKLVTCA